MHDPVPSDCVNFSSDYFWDVLESFQRQETESYGDPYEWRHWQRVECRDRIVKNATNTALVGGNSLHSCAVLQTCIQ